MEAEQSRTRSEAEHKKTAANYNSCISHMRQLEKKLKRSINKSRSAFPSSPLAPFHTYIAQAGLCVRRKAHLCHLMQPRCLWHGCVVLGCIPCVRVKECSCSRTTVIPVSGFSSIRLRFSSTFFPCRPYFELKAKYYLQLEVCTVEQLKLTVKATPYDTHTTFLWIPHSN